MAYSADYSHGYLCEPVNRQYAKLHGYEFSSEVLPSEQMLQLIQPRLLCYSGVECKLIFQNAADLFKI
jgi:hypothetical protein